MEILICDNIDKLNEDFIERCKEILPEWRKEQMLRIKHLPGRVQCAVAYFLVEFCKNKNFPITARCDKWKYNEHGKPYFEDRNDLYFSISHCKSAVAAVVDDEEVGVDIEEISRYRESLVRYVTNESEIMENGVEGKAEKFIELWTKKEAVFKYLGTGITHEIKDILKNNADINVVSRKIGNKYLSVVTRKVVNNEDVKCKFVNVEDFRRINH